MDFEKMSLSALREAAKNSGIKSVSALKKAELIELLKKESASIEKAAEELERFAAEDEQNLDLMKPENKLIEDQGDMCYDSTNSAVMTAVQGAFG